VCTEELGDCGEKIGAAGAPRCTAYDKGEVSEEVEAGVGDGAAELRSRKAVERACQAEGFELAGVGKDVGECLAVCGKVAGEGNTGEIPEREGVYGECPGHVVERDGTEGAILGNETICGSRIALTGGIRHVMEAVAFEMGQINRSVGASERDVLAKFNLRK
jgi:hypothetical protein